MEEGRKGVGAWSKQKRGMVCEEMSWGQGAAEPRGVCGG